MRSINERLSSRNMVAMIMGFSICFMTISFPSFADTPWNVGVTVGSHGINSFSLSVGEYYGIPERDVVIIHEQGIYEEELPIVFYIAQRAHVYPEDVVDLHLSGMSWMDITLYFGLSPEIYYVPVVIDRYDPPYGHAYGYYHNCPRGGWKRSDLRDRDIVNQVNLKFISEHHRYAPEKIMRYRSEGRSFNTIDRDISNEKYGKGRYQNRSDTNQNENRQNQYKQNTTRQNKKMQTVTKPNEYRKNQFATRQNQQLMQNVPKPNEYRQNDYRQNQNTQNMTKQNHHIHNVPKPNEYRQNQYIRNGNNQHEYAQITEGKSRVKKGGVTEP